MVKLNESKAPAAPVSHVAAPENGSPTWMTPMDVACLDVQPPSNVTERTSACTGAAATATNSVESAGWHMLRMLGPPPLILGFGKDYEAPSAARVGLEGGPGLRATGEQAVPLGSLHSRLRAR
jgi:hypothetical protein